MVARKQVEADLEHACLMVTQAQQSGHIRSFESIANARASCSVFGLHARCASPLCTRIRTTR